MQNQACGLMPERLIQDDLLEQRLYSLSIKDNPFQPYKAYIVYSIGNSQYSKIISEVTTMIKTYFAHSNQST